MPIYFNFNLIKSFLVKIGIFLICLISYLPFWVLYLISNFLYIVLYRLTKYRLKVVRENMKNAFPEKTEMELLILEKKYYRYLGDLVVESLKAITISKAQILKRLTYKNPEIFNKLYDEGRSAIVVMGHYANWELMCKGSPLLVKNEILGAYKPLSNKLFDELMFKSRTEFGTNMIPMEKIPRAILKAEKPFVLVLIADQSPSHKESSIWVNFLNQETAVLPGAEKLAQKYNLPVIFANIICYKRGYYSCELSYIAKQPKETNNITELHTHKLESIIKEKPEYWVWSHRRWKMKR